jgi:hypothetical protein
LLPSYLKLNISAKAVCETRSLYSESYFSVLVLDDKCRVAERPLLLDGSDRGAGWSLHVDGLEAAGKAARLASEGSVEVNHLLVVVVLDDHAKGAHGTAAVAGATVGVFFGVVDLLAHGVLHLVLVLCLAT